MTCKISRPKAPSWWTPSLNLNLVRWASKGMKPPFSAMAKSHQDFCFNGPSDCTTQVFNAFNAFHASKKWKNHKLWWTVFLCILHLDLLIFGESRVENVETLRIWSILTKRVSSRDMIHHVRLSVLTHCRQVCFSFIQDYGKCEQTQPSI